jgi:hypothetical protein
MRLVFVHGMRQERKDPVALKATWDAALTRTWARLGLTRPTNYDSVMPYYGDTLENLTQAARGGASAVVARGPGGPAEFTLLEQDLIRSIAPKLGVTSAEVDARLGSEVVARGPANWEWVQSAARILDDKVPILGNLALGFVRQVDAYLTRSNIHDAVNDIVAPAFAGGPRVIVAHSLGTIVSYLVLRRIADNPGVPLFVTLGSPLGIPTVKQYLKPPSLGKPNGVGDWLNGVDERDYVALVSKLDKASFADGIDNVSDIQNRKEDAHSIEDYLADARIAEKIHAAISL